MLSHHVATTVQGAAWLLMCCAATATSVVDTGAVATAAADGAAVRGDAAVFLLTSAL
jgi:hypothetical protein